LAEESVRDFEDLVSLVPQAHQPMWAFSGLAHGAHALPPRERGTMPANPHKLLQLGEIGRTKRPAMSTRAGGGSSGSLCPVFSAISSPQVLTRCGAVKPGGWQSRNARSAACGRFPFTGKSSRLPTKALCIQTT